MSNNSSVLMKIIAPATLTLAALTASISVQAAPITESAVQSYASAMKSAANNKSLSQVSSLVDDEALISMSRNGKTTSLDKAAYLKLLQDSWAQTSNYHYDITITDIVTSGEQAKANVRTTETWTKNGQPTTLTTSSRATLKSTNNNAVLLRAVTQITIN